MPAATQRAGILLDCAGGGLEREDWGGCRCKEKNWDCGQGASSRKVIFLHMSWHHCSQGILGRRQGSSHLTALATQPSNPGSISLWPKHISWMWFGILFMRRKAPKKYATFILHSGITLWWKLEPVGWCNSSYKGWIWFRMSNLKEGWAGNWVTLELMKDQHSSPTISQTAGPL